MANYKRIKTGMSRAEVENILGGKGKQISSSSGGGMSLYQSLYETALKQGLPRSIIEVMTRVFANDVDFQRGAFWLRQVLPYAYLLRVPILIWLAMLLLPVFALPPHAMHR